MNNILYNIYILHTMHTYTYTRRMIHGLLLVYLGYILCLICPGHAHIIDDIYLVLFPINIIIMNYVMYRHITHHANGHIPVITTIIIMSIILDGTITLQYTECLTRLWHHTLYDHHDTAPWGIIPGVATASYTPIHLLYILGYMCAPSITLTGKDHLSRYIEHMTQSSIQAATQHQYVSIMRRMPRRIRAYINHHIPAIHIP